MASILLVSKPVAPPWNDSSKNLVRDLALGMGRHHPVVMGRRGVPFELPQGTVEGLYPPRAGGFAPSLSDNARVAARLLAGRRLDLWHFFFAPNPRSSMVGSLASRVRRVPTVQTVCSAPRPEADVAGLLFADVTVVLSEHTERRLLEGGVAPDRLCRIPPAIGLLDPPGDDARRAARSELGLPVDAPLLVYPGDLEFGRGAWLAVDALAEVTADAHLAIACRVKTGAAREAERELRDHVSVRGLGSRVSWIGETPLIHDLLGAADVVLLPTDTLYAKMDHPLVLLEAMSMERAVVVACGTAAEELAAGGGALAVEPDTDAIAEAVALLLGDDGRRAALGARARDHVARENDRAGMARAYESVYEDLLP